MRYGANFAAVVVNLPLAVLYAVTARPGQALPAAAWVLIIAGLVGLTAWKFPRGETRSSFQWFTFLSLLGSALLWLGICLLDINGDRMPAVAYTGINVLLYGGPGLILCALFGSYISIRKERGF